MAGRRHTLAIAVIACLLAGPGIAAPPGDFDAIVDRQLARLAADAPEERTAGVKGLRDLLGSLGGRGGGEGTEAARHVVERCRDEAMPLLVDRLVDPDRETRQAAAWVVHRIAPVDERWTRPILDAIRVDAFAHESIANAQTLSLALARRGWPVLDAIARDLASPDPKLAGAAVVALVGFEADAPDERCEPVVPRLLDALDHEAVWVRFCAARVLGYFRCEPGRSVPALIAALRDESATVRRGARTGLARYGHEAVGALDALVALVEGGSGDMQPACKVLAQLGPAAAPAVPALIVALGREETYPGQRVDVLNALGAVGPAAIAALGEIDFHRDSPNRAVQRAADEAFHQILR